MRFVLRLWFCDVNGMGRRVGLAVLLLFVGAWPVAAAVQGEADWVARAAAATAQAQAIEERDALTAVEREAAAGMARAAADAWTAAAQAEEDAQGQADFIATAAPRIAAAREEAELLAKQEGQATPAVSAFEDIVDAATALREAEAILSRARAASGEATADQAAATSRLATLKEELVAARSIERAALDDVDQPSLDENQNSALLGPLRLDLMEAQRSAARQQVLQLEQLELALPMRSDLAIARRRVADQRAKLAKVKVVQLRSQVEALRQAEAHAAENAAEANVQAAAKLPEPFPAWALRSVVLARLTGDAAVQQVELREAMSESSLAAEELTQSLALGEDRVEAAAMTQATSAMFLAERRELPLIAPLQAELESRQKQLIELSTRLLDMKDERRRLTREGPLALDGVPEAQAQMAGKILSQFTEGLDDALAATSVVLDAATSDLDAADRHLAVVRQYGDFLDGRLLWTPDLKALRPSDGPLAVRDVTRWLTHLNMGQVVAELTGALKRTPVLVMLLGMVGAVLLGLRRRLERAVRNWHEPVGRLAADRFGYTAKAFAGDVLISCTFPILLLAVGLSFRSAGEFALIRAAGSALTALAVVLVPLFLMRRLARKGGLAVKHFEWPEAACLALRRALSWLIPLLAGTSLVVAFIGAQPSAEVDLRSVGRLVLMGTMLTLAVFLGRLLRRDGALAAAMMRSGGPIGRTHWLWYVLVVASPVAVAALAGWGYYYTALRLESRLLATVLLGTGLLIAYAMALRWLRLTHRRLSYAELLRKREAARVLREEAAAKALAEAQADGEELVEPEAMVPIPDTEEHITPFALNEQTGKLIGSAAVAAMAVGLWAVWKDVLPALGILNDVTLWSQMRRIDGVDTVESITLGAILLGVIAVSLTWTAARHLPGLVDLVVLGRFGLQSGTRHAITLLMQYVIVGIGLSLALSEIGFGWSRLQWLIAALSVGLGFGLQEIFANFVSGLIILFERPIRLGDTVTVADRTGVVTKIRIRATTITDLNQCELIVPNKEFVTNSLVNWSLSSPVTRLIVPVGIAYGADTRLAQKLLQDIAIKNKSVLKDPPPVALFLEFGDNSLNFELRVFVTDVLRRFPIKSELHLAIDDAFRDANISIAFPQRDVHLDQIGPLEIKLTDPSVPLPRGAVQSS